jgi:hypothetical protein
MAEPMSDDAVTTDGAHLGPFRINGTIRRDAAGVVYDAEDLRFGRRVALRALPAEWANDPERRQQAQQAARAAAAITHPTLAVIYALEEIDGHLYLASEYVEGRPLSETLTGGPLPLEEAAAVGRAAADALAYAHNHGVVHGALSPECLIRLPDGRIKIVDIGPGIGFDRGGAAPYAAPEQLSSGVTGAAADQFALGAILHALAGGRRPLDGGHVRPPLAATAPQALDLDRVIDVAMATAPLRRFPTMAAMAEALRAVEIRPAPAPHAGSLAWWQMRQVITAVGYGAALYLLWATRNAAPGPWGEWLWRLGAGAALLATTLRLQAWLASLLSPATWAADRRRTWAATRLADFAFGVTLLVAASRMQPVSPRGVVLLLGSAVLVLVAIALLDRAPRV